MNESDLEAELRKLIPKAPVPALVDRIATELHTAPDGRLVAIASSHSINGARYAGVIERIDRKRPGFFVGWRWLGAASVVVVAAVVLVLSNANRSADPHSGNSVAEQNPSAIDATLSETPDESVDELIQTSDEGLVYDDGAETPQRQLRLVYLERHTWTNPQTGAVVELEVPREDIVLMPVAMQ